MKCHYFVLLLALVLCSVVSCTHPSGLELRGFGGGGFDQGDDNGRRNGLLLRLLRTRQPERRHWVNTVPGSGKGRETKTGRGGCNIVEREGR